MTKTFRLVLAAVCGSVLLSGCDSTSPGAAPSIATSSPAVSSSASGAVALAAGKSMLPLAAGRYRSPEGFQPSLNLTVPDGWTSTHRGSDAFDLGKPDPARDAPLIAVVFFAPSAPTASAALAALRKVAISGTVTTVSADIGGVPAQGIDIDGGSGQLIASADNGISLDAAPGQRVRLLAADFGGRPLVVVVLVPDGKQWDAAWAQATQVLSGVTPA